VVPDVVHEDENGILSVAYVELVPILIEAFKEHIKNYENTKGKLFQQMEVLDTKLQSMQLQLDKVETKNESILSEKTRDLIFSPTQFFIPAPVQVEQMEEEEYLEESFCCPGTTSSSSLKDDERWRQGFLRTSILVVFFLGLVMTIAGSIFLGITLASPQEILTSVVEAINLRATDQDGVPDPYCEVSVGSSLFRTDTLYNTPNPLWEETFSTDYDKSVYYVVFQMYDQNEYSYRDLKIGFAQVEVDVLDSDKRYEQWLPLNSNSNDNETSGQLKVALYISTQKQPSYELAILIVGVLLTLVGLILGFYSWRNPSLRKKTS